MPMNQEIKREWVAALRSGDYQQGDSALSQNGKHCCLGVLCELAVKAGVAQAHGEALGMIDYGPAGAEFYVDGGWDDVLLPRVVQEWAGFQFSSPDVRQGGELRALSSLNDRITYADETVDEFGEVVYDDEGTHDFSFTEIADLIEADPEL